MVKRIALNVATVAYRATDPNRGSIASVALCRKHARGFRPHAHAVEVPAVGLCYRCIAGLVGDDTQRCTDYENGVHGGWRCGLLLYHDGKHVYCRD